MMNSKKEIDSEIKTLQDKIDSLNREKKSLEEMGPERSLAVFMHGKLCTSNHTDGCGWEYEEGYAWERTGTTKNRYLLKARKLLAFLDQETIMNIIVILREC